MDAIHENVSENIFIEICQNLNQLIYFCINLKCPMHSLVRQAAIGTVDEK